MSYQPPPLKQFFHNIRRFAARIWLSHQKALQIAITGSQGKTNTTRLLAHILSSVGKTISTDIDLDTIYNVPITALKVKPGTKYAVFELGIDHPNEMDFHLQIVQPKISIVTGISPVHTDKEHLGSLENLINEKRKLIEVLPRDGFAVLNYDDKNVRKMAPYTKAKIFWYGTDKNHCHIWTDPKTIKLTLQGTCFKLFSTSFNLNQQISTRLIGRHHIYTVMSAYLVYRIVTNSADLGPFKQILTNLKPLPGRMSVEAGPKQTVVLNDSLRANPASTTSGLQTLSDIDYKNGRKVAVLAEMGELEKPEAEHKKIGRLIAKIPGINFIIFIGPFQKYAYQEAVNLGFKKENIISTKNVIEAGEVLQKIIKRGDLIYLKGSLLRHVERVLLILEEKNVGCSVISCPFYWQCPKCPYLSAGYQNDYTSKV